MRKNTLFVAVLLVFLGFKAGAYIPSYSLIMSHLAYSQGRVSYRIELELFFKGGGSFSLKEIWWIRDPKHIRLDVKSKDTKKLYFRFIYKNNKKWFKDAKGLLQSQRISHYHIEKPFHLRSALALRKLFALWGVAPFEPAEREPGQGFDPFLRLSRKGGSLQYEISKGGQAGVWLEQDEFVIRSWRWKTGEHLSAWDYKLYPGHFFFPSRRLFRQKSGEVEIKLKRVRNIKIDKKWFHKSRLKPSAKDQSLPSLVQDKIHEFYKKFR